VILGYIVCDVEGCEEHLRVTASELNNRYWRSSWVKKQGWSEEPGHVRGRSRGRGDRRRVLHKCPLHVDVSEAKALKTEIPVGLRWPTEIEVPSPPEFKVLVERLEQVVEHLEEAK
jgi:hypothetical protein